MTFTPMLLKRWRSTDIDNKKCFLRIKETSFKILLATSVYQSSKVWKKSEMTMKVGLCVILPNEIKITVLSCVGHFLFDCLKLYIYSAVL